MLTAFLVEDNSTLRAALKTGLEATGEPFLVASGGGLPTVSRDETLVYLETLGDGADDRRRGIVVVENWLAEGSRGE